MRFLDYLGRPAAHLLTSAPFNTWQFKRTVDEDLPDNRVNHVADRCDFSFACDTDETITTIFIESDDFGQFLSGISFSRNRREVQGFLGAPSKSGKPYSDPILGEYGPWDRYDGGRHSIHIEYQPYADRIRRITLMREDVVP
ncbi:MAG: hypothetical protein E5W09_19015 [Mesorhizobium sp.]|uniref:hypothetical protein n=1 Tax=Mesorhizobium sp. TaxID=1871066 RepID=UPI000FE9BC94|nr:hypothetical protein [Mesorhizobium sp.]RWE56472.1 MAG: hypothetical protein EOS67_18940 [Mesorhizobium sp.]TIS78716.1 MAG: hypothetical protein E5W94_08505 [Mesorhizobium sp.]TIU96023.1 MAG: hypothetical protein E5W09_19015 [Mesorhizobium sp.]TKD39168.1 MAG: hypothetical protein E5W98_22915 [Mesorhizobium sp.]